MAKEKPRSTDQAGTGPDPRLSRHLLPLREAKRYRLAKGEPDIRGWSVYTSTGQEVGRVGDLLVDTAMGEVVMFDVNRGDTGDQTIAPLRAAWIDRETRRVIIDAAYLAPVAAQPDVYTTTTTMRSPVPPAAPPATVSDEELAREADLDARALPRDERTLPDERTVRSNEIAIDRRLGDRDAPPPPEEAPLPPRGAPPPDLGRYDDFPDRPA